MNILFYSPDGKPEPWIEGFARALPEAQLQVWREDDATPIPADYAVLWKPPAALLQGRSDLKAVFNLGAGVDGVLQLGAALPASVPIVRLEDAGMALQMAEYVSHAVLRYFRRFDQYELQARDGQWRFLPPYDKQDFAVGILGLGVLGSRMAAALQHFGFRVNGWSRNHKVVPGVHSYAGSDELDQFLCDSRVLVCALPLTPETTNLLDRRTLEKLPHAAYLINVARGAHLVEEDLLALVQNGHIAGATLDVVRKEPLPPTHPFWQEPRITLTPHVAALTLRDESIRQIADKIRALQRGEPIAGLVDRNRGY
ncbi:2-hydroxyacid dehydrogenase [Undibacterium arcticum]|uniref:2-hydroxyacid dehydrogenase n=1 Tax=Undibacterium arcticum TaxID=1762892 RepID=A0ABV7F2U9_9BURK